LTITGGSIGERRIPEEGRWGGLRVFSIKTEKIEKDNTPLNWGKDSHGEKGEPSDYFSMNKTATVDWNSYRAKILKRRAKRGDNRKPRGRDWDVGSFKPGGVSHYLVRKRKKGNWG